MTEQAPIKKNMSVQELTIEIQKCLERAEKRREEIREKVQARLYDISLVSRIEAQNGSTKSLDGVIAEYQAALKIIGEIRLDHEL